MPDDLATQIADQLAKRDALPKYTDAWAAANDYLYKLRQTEIAQRRAKRLQPLSDRYTPVKGEA